jgi:tRNA(Ile)-lysidine synthase
MASSRNSRQADDEVSVAAVRAALAAALKQHVPPGASFALALSGGIDSMVLLDGVCELAAGHPLRLSAVHVHHGISPNADAWAAFCAEQCAARDVPLTIRRLSLARERQTSLEAQARKLRYECLAASGAEVIGLAHHADDQAETLLLQLLRGAGPHGLAAMPAFRPGHPALLRPLIDIARETLVACAHARKLSWIEDESNTDARYARNFLRHEIAPLLRDRFPGYPATLVRAASHQADAAILADELAAIDGADAADAAGLSCERLARLSPARARNLLRWYLRERGLRSPTEAHLADMLRQLLCAADDARIRIAQDGAEIGRHRGRIAVHAPVAASFEQVWRGEPEVVLPCGVLAFASTRGGGVSAAKLGSSRVTLRSRGGGERIRLALNRPTRAVKKLLQEARLPAWERQSLPLVWSDDDLVAVPGIGIALAFQSAADEAGWRIEWRPRRPG